MASELLQPLDAGEIRTANRVWMAPLTRCRAGPGQVPTPLNAQYYAQRSSAGLIVSEATQISLAARGYPDTPGMHTPQQVEGWRRVTGAVHAAGGKIVCQLWHVGRVSHPAYQPDGRPPLAPSELNCGGDARVPDGAGGWIKLPRVTPRAATPEDLAQVRADYAVAARFAREAGFDGVELHAANTYLLDQFLRSRVNRRTDEYGGSLANRARLLFEVLERIVEQWGPGRVGIRLSPQGETATHQDDDPRETFTHVLERLNDYPLAYAHVMRAWGADQDAKPRLDYAHWRRTYRGVLVANAGFTPDEASAWIRDGLCDAVAFGELFIANPDLPARIARGAPLQAPDPSTYYTPGPKGYTDYPALASG